MRKTKKFKIIFYVVEVAADGNLEQGNIIEPQQIVSELPLDELCMGPDKKTMTSEQLEAYGVIISRFLTTKLREWARAQKADG